MQQSSLISRKNQFAEEVGIALRECTPVVLGVVPFGITCGIMGLTAQLSGFETILMSVLVFAGASQFIGITMLGAGITGWGIIVLTTLLVNLRHLIMGSSLAPYMIKLPLPLQAFMAFFLTDEAYALTISRIPKTGYSVLYQVTVSTTLYLVWVLATVAGVFLGSYISDPLTWGLDFAMPATFLVLLIPMLASRISLIVFGIAGVVSVFGALYLPGKWYIIVACLTASLIGGLLEGESNHAK
ncbi:AzlC family ABC transporter permease [Desulfosporosinus sp. HMP52]|uniref:AzlC family ABC transporter permease n=1 Tax=Desulfosporosinus sp. HMP52 TaxID=1487923 RepID=UPI0009E067EA|nr:AzlC family ABC transporter permease [Desulfosporosinus sp. HMP52]